TEEDRAGQDHRAEREHEPREVDAREAEAHADRPRANPGGHHRDRLAACAAQQIESVRAGSRQLLEALAAGRVELARRVARDREWHPRSDARERDLLAAVERLLAAALEWRDQRERLALVHDHAHRPQRARVE